METKITQGSIIYPFKSEKYPQTKCYGVIISAKCDISNRKISKIYYLIALNVIDWIATDIGISTVFKDDIRNKEAILQKKLETYRLSSKALLSMEKEAAEKVIDIMISDINQKQMINDLYQSYYKLCRGSSEERYQYVRSKEKSYTKFLERATNGSVNHYFFLPQAAYSDDNVMHDGLIVDLQEIGHIPISDYVKMCNPGIHKLTLHHPSVSKKEKERWDNIYYLEDDNVYVQPIGEIESPWCECLMQRFSNDFIRIGVNGPSAEDYSKLIKSMEEQKHENN